MASFKLNWGAFLTALAIGMFFVYINTPKPKVVIKYPNPDNINNIVYKDEAENCYMYKADKVECTKDKVQQPVSI